VSAFALDGGLQSHSGPALHLCLRCTHDSPSEELQKSARPRRPVQGRLDVPAQQPALRRRIGQPAVRKTLDFDHSERPKLIAVRLQHPLPPVQSRGFRGCCAVSRVQPVPGPKKSAWFLKQSPPSHIWRPQP
jgi:hypothetical protein